MSCRTLNLLPLSATTVPSETSSVASSLWRRLTLVTVSSLLFLGVSRAEAETITWHWAGPVNGYVGCVPGMICGSTLDTVVPLGTPIDVFWSFNPEVPPNAQLPCLRGTSTASLQVLGRTYTSTGFVWDEAHGFGPGMCVPGYDFIEVVVPSWGSGGPALPDGWIPFSPFFLPGLWWAGDLTSVQPTSIASQFPTFYKPGHASPQRFTAHLQAVPADIQAVPEPATLTMFGLGLAAIVSRRRRSRKPE